VLPFLLNLFVFRLQQGQTKRSVLICLPNLYYFYTREDIFSMNNEHGCAYLALIPRGFQYSVQESILEQLKDFNVRIEFVAEAIADARTHCNAIAADLKEKQNHGRNKQGDIEDCCTLPVGSTLFEDRMAHVGYLHHRTPIWLSNGELQGTVWARIETDAPVDLVANQMRIIGPLIALVNVWEGADLSPSQTLEEAIQRTRSLVQSHDYPFQSALDLWHEHVKASWRLSGVELEVISEKIRGDQQMKYRLSCVRADSEKYTYSRQQYLAQAADIVTPSALGNAWKVDLSDYDVEVVLLVQSHALAIGLALRPYKQLKSRSFSAGNIPLDTSQPHLESELLSSVIRLRPSTAQILLYLADLEQGDIVLDPCSGAGTIPVEAMLHKPVLAIGGDLALTPDGLAPLAAGYCQRARTVKRKTTRDASCMDQVAWDSTRLPMRDACVDAIVSDLPFGKQCLSRAKLDQILPLIFAEMARVLRPTTGRMVLLCGNFYQAVKFLKALNNINHEFSSSPSSEVVMQMPCDSIFPVSIGGLLAWVIVAKRGSAAAREIPNHRQRVKALTGKRERVAKQRSNTPGKKKRNILQTG